jgi:uncharacterized membrane protein YfcA
LSRGKTKKTKWIICIEHAAIGTDRFGTVGIGVAGLYSFHRQGMMRYRLAFIVGIPCLIGAVIGANLALQISPELLKKFIVALTVILLIVVVVNPRLGVAVTTKHPITTTRYALGIFLCLLVGIYGGFYGAGAATFLSYVMILVFRQTFLESAGADKKVTVCKLTGYFEFAKNFRIVFKYNVTPNCIPENQRYQIVMLN